ncbi:ShlB/FhaC/HecB family hemolysin secretion/activation protein [Polaromonas sp.]|jgi:hemolysin activation/secretion protein|uniref:ShlB/FhaC/HecB family hemolysin secretion/activation protein n=1 Tax=Polaromonas sp. TaxID=1869339 RepID=UPI0037C8DCA5
MHQTHRPAPAIDTHLSTAPRRCDSWRFPLNKSLVPFALLVLSQSLLAQQVPGAGSQMQQIPAAPVPQKAPPEIRIERGTAPVAATADEAKILVRSLRVTGAKAYTEAELIAITGFTPGTELTLTDLNAMASKITTHYAKSGYFVARAYLPAQQIANNTVTIEVSEGQYGKIILRNQSTLSDAQANRLLSGLNSGDPITNDPLESRLLLLSDTPGVNVKSTLVPGATPGTSDLIVDITPGKRVSGSVDFDNAGNRYTGEYRLGATVNLNNPLGLGDQASVRAVTSGSGLNYGRASYQVPFGKTTVGVAYSRLEYELGKEFAPLGANGTAEIASIYGIRPLIRSRNNNLYAQLAYEARTFQDRIDSTIPRSVTDRKADVLMASLYGDHRDNLGGGGISAYSLTWSIGDLDIQTPAALAADAASARTNGSYNKLAFTATRLQRVTNLVSLYGSISGQVASKNLDSSEKMDLGGMNGVRAYPQGEASGDQGYLVNLEARLLLAGLSERVPGQVHLIGFVDAGSVTIHKNPWFTGSNHRNLGAYGVGASWGEPGNFLVRTYYARKLGNEAALSAPDKSGRFWIQAIKYF